MEQNQTRDLNDYRNTIRDIDRQITELFTQRMETAKKIAVYKKNHALPILDVDLECRKLNEITDLVPDELRDYVRQLYTTVFELSRGYQNKLIGAGNALTRLIQKAIEEIYPLFPAESSVACQGVEGAYSQIACSRLIRNANTMFFSSFDAVFSAVEKGLCQYGIIPLENSTAGSVNAVYDLMQKHSFSIVRSVRVKVDHHLLAPQGTDLEDIREIYSHEQAFAQCSEFLKTLKNVKLIPYENTAIAAKIASGSGRKDVASLSSRTCASLYHLNCLKESVQNLCQSISSELPQRVCAEPKQ